MYNIFIAVIFLLFLSSCSEDKVKEHNEIVAEQTEAPVNTNTNDQVTPQNNNSEESTTETIIPEQDSSQEPVASLSNVTTKEDPVTFNVDKNDMVLGNKESKVVLVEYFSPTCPHCAYYHSTIFLEIKKKYIDTNKIAYVIRECIGHKQDLDAAILARCKGDLDSFLQFHSITLEQQDKWAYSNKYRELLTDIGRLGGIPAEQYKQCLSNDKITEILIANTNFIMRNPKFRGTPSFFINGVPLEQSYTIGNISAAIDKALEANKIEI